METHPSDLEFVLDDDIAVSKVPLKYQDLVDSDLDFEASRQRQRRNNPNRWE